jgi:hypothetical protein
VSATLSSSRTPVAWTRSRGASWRSRCCGWSSRRSRRRCGEPGRIDAFSFAPWLAVLLLFVLAGVFAHGARMRADLEGTV